MLYSNLKPDFISMLLQINLTTLQLFLIILNAYQIGPRVPKNDVTAALNCGIKEK